MDKYSSKKSDAKGERFKFKLLEGDVDPAMEVYKKPRVRISVEGYDTTLPEEDIKKALVDLFESCGEIIRVTVPIDPRTRLVERRAFIILRGDGAEDKALQLDGSLVGGSKVTVRLAATVGRGRSPSPSHASEPVIGYCIPCHIVFLSQEINEKIMAFKKKKGLV